MQISKPTFGRQDIRLSGGCAEPAISANALLNALSGDDTERYRALLPVGYSHVAEAYRRAAHSIDAGRLTGHYTEGLEYFHSEFVPYLKSVLEELSGGAWNLADFVGFAAGSDVDLISHVLNSITSEETVVLHPGDWYGFLVGSAVPGRLVWTAQSFNRFACICVPSVRNGHCTEEMVRFLEQSKGCLLNINLFPTLDAEERNRIAKQLNPVLTKSMLVVSFSRGFGLTISQLGVLLVHRENKLLVSLKRQLDWFTYFYNRFAASAFQLINPGELHAVDDRRRRWVSDWLEARGLPVVDSGTYYVKSFTVDAVIPELRPLMRDGIVRLCFKPPIS
jgi:hypothetical protein